MIVRWLDNWPYKLLALAIALMLRVYVGNMQGTHNTQSLNVPVALHNVPANLVPLDAPATVAVVLSGPSPLLETVRVTDVMATIDLNHAKSGVNAGLPIVVSLPPNVKGQIQVEQKTPVVGTVNLDPTDEAPFHINVSFARTAPIGYSYQLPHVFPDTARVDGPESILKTVHQLVVYADTDSDFNALPTTVDGVYDIVALDARGSQVQGLTITPKEARVLIPVTRIGAMKELMISPTIVGTPKYPAHLIGIDVYPTMTTVSGPAPLLAQTSVIATMPINVDGATDSLRRNVPLDLPKGLIAVQTVPVEVQIRLDSHATPILPAPIAPAAKSSPGAHPA